MAQGAQRQRRLTRFDNLEAATAAIDAGTFAGTSALDASSTLGGLAFSQPISSPVAGATGALVTSHGVPYMWEYTWTAEVISVVDSGGAGGGWAAPVLLTLPTMYYYQVGSYLEITIASVGGGIGATADVLFGIGTTATTTGTPSGGNIDHNLLNTITLSGGAGTGTTLSSIVIGQFNNLADAIGDLYLNIGVADADISATADVTFSGVFRSFGFEMSV